MRLPSLLDTGVDIDQWLATLNRIALPNDSFKVIIEQVFKYSLVVRMLIAKILSNPHKCHFELSLSLFTVRLLDFGSLS